MLSHKKKIAFFFPSFHVGGVEKVFITYANKLIEDDYYEVLIFVCKKEGELLSLVNTSITVVSLNKRLGLCSQYICFDVSSLIQVKNKIVNHST